MDHQISGNSGVESCGIAAVAFTFLEEKAGSKLAFVGKQPCNSSCNRRLSCASHAIQLEYRFAVSIFRPFRNVMLQLNSSIFKTSYTVLLHV